MNATSLMERLLETAVSVAVASIPLAVLFIVFQILLLKLPWKDVSNILVGTSLAAVGLFLFLLGVGIGFIPFGKAIGEALGALGQDWILMPIGLLLGFFTTWGEPAVRILAGEVENASSGSIRRSVVLYATSIGVAFAIAAGIIRIIYNVPFLYIVIPGYLYVVLAMWLSDDAFVSIAIDAGGVATGPVANTFLLSLAIGLSSSVNGQPSMIDGLGMVALIALAPVMSIMSLGLLIRQTKSQTE